MLFSLNRILEPSAQALGAEEIVRKTLAVAAKKEKPVICKYTGLSKTLLENAYNSNKVDTALTSGSSASMRPMELFSGEELTERPKNTIRSICILKWSFHSSRWILGSLLKYHCSFLF